LSAEQRENLEAVLRQSAIPVGSDVRSPSSTGSPPSTRPRRSGRGAGPSRPDPVGAPRQRRTRHRI